MMILDKLVPHGDVSKTLGLRVLVIRIFTHLPGLRIWRDLRIREADVILRIYRLVSRVLGEIKICRYISIFSMRSCMDVSKTTTLWTCRQPLHTNNARNYAKLILKLVRRFSLKLSKMMYITYIWTCEKLDKISWESLCIFYNFGCVFFYFLQVCFGEVCAQA